MMRVYLVRGAQATTAIEGNTLSEEEVAAQLEGRLQLPPSRAYLAQEVENALAALTETFEAINGGDPPRLTPDWIADINRRLLAGLDDHLGEGVIPGEIPVHSVIVGRYRGAPREDCRFLLDRLCQWIEGGAFRSPGQSRGDEIESAVIRAILAHLYIAWIHPFGDGNGRTARLVEFRILARAGVPAPCAHLLSNHYNRTRAEYYRQLDRSSRANSGQGDSLGFLRYSLQGLADGLREQCRYIEGVQLRLAWEHYVYQRFGEMRKSDALRRRRELTLALGRKAGSVPKPEIASSAPRLAALYANTVPATLSRDLNWLVKEGFLERGDGGYRARVGAMLAFRARRAEGSGSA